jgi:lipopolysaccharide export system protein LptC
LSHRSQSKKIYSRSGKIGGLIKLFFPAIALAIVGLTFAWPQVMPDKRKFGVAANLIGEIGVDDLFIEQPKYVGMDRSQRPYQISATSAAQKHKADDQVLLQGPKADIFLNTSSWIAINSNQGVYNRSNQVLDLSGDVTIFHDQGYEFRTRALKIDLLNGIGSSTTQVNVRGLAGEISSEGFKISRQGTRVLFTGKSIAILRGSRRSNL